MALNQHYISNPELSGSSSDIGLVSLEEGHDFILSASITQLNKESFNLKFHVLNEDASKEYTISFSNTNFDGNYVLTDPYVTTSSKLNPILGKHTYFYQRFCIKQLSDGSYRLYKKITSEDSPNLNWKDYFKDEEGTFAYSDELGYSLINKNGSYYIQKVNKLREDGLPIKPMLVKSTSGSTNLTNEILFDNNNFLDSNDNNFIRIIISPFAEMITFWVKKEVSDVYKKEKTFSFPGGIEKAGFKLSFDGGMSINDLSFSFFKSNIV